MKKPCTPELMLDIWNVWEFSYCIEYLPSRRTVIVGDFEFTTYGEIRIRYGKMTMDIYATDRDDYEMDRANQSRN